MKISITYEIITDESAEYCDFAESGFESENEPCGFIELLDTIRNEGFTNPDCSHGLPRCLSNETEQDYITGEYITRTIHPGKDKNSMKYWRKAMLCLGYKEV